MLNKPSVINVDEMALWDEDDLYRRTSYLEGEKMKLLQRGQNPYFWEVEISWTQREIGLRKERRSKHEEYLKSIPSDFLEEVSLEDEVDFN